MIVCACVSVCVYVCLCLMVVSVSVSVYVSLCLSVSVCICCLSLVCTNGVLVLCVRVFSLATEPDPPAPASNAKSTITSFLNTFRMMRSNGSAISAYRIQRRRMRGQPHPEYSDSSDSEDETGTGGARASHLWTTVVDKAPIDIAYDTFGTEGFPTSADDEKEQHRIVATHGTSGRVAAHWTTGLFSGTQHQIRVQTCNAVGWSKPSEPAYLSVTLASFPYAPQKLQLYLTASYVVHAMVYRPHDNGARVTAYDVQFRRLRKRKGWAPKRNPLDRLRGTLPPPVPTPTGGTVTVDGVEESPAPESVTGGGAGAGAGAGAGSGSSRPGSAMSSNTAGSATTLVSRLALCWGWGWCSCVVSVGLGSGWVGLALCWVLACYVCIGLCWLVLAWLCWLVGFWCLIAVVLLVCLSDDQDYDTDSNVFGPSNEQIRAGGWKVDEWVDIGRYQREPTKKVPPACLTFQFHVPSPDDVPEWTEGVIPDHEHPEAERTTWVGHPAVGAWLGLCVCLLVCWLCDVSLTITAVVVPIEQVLTQERRV